MKETTNKEIKSTTCFIANELPEATEWTEEVRKENAGEIYFAADSENKRDFKPFKELTQDEVLSFCTNGLKKYTVYYINN